MITLTVYYNKADDPETFEKRYIAEHMPLVEGWKAMTGQAFGRIATTVSGSVPFTHLFIGHWESAESLQADMASDATGPIMKNAGELAPEGFTAVTIEWLAS